MPLLTVSNISHAYGTHRVLDGATLSIEPGEKIGLVGRNGSGKTTLMKVMLGALSPDSGAVQLQRGARVGYLSQHPTLDAGDTVRDAAERAFAELHDLHVRLNAVYDRMAEADGAALDALLRKQSRLEAQIEAAGGYVIDHKIDATLHGLGFTDAEFSQNVASLSGGQKARLGLARLLLEQPDLLLLDEPTNHLDIAGREWLENFLADEYAGAVVIVSHDRWLLDRVVSRMVEVERGAIREYPGNYEKYVTLRRERHLTTARLHEKQQDRIRQEEQFIRRYKAGQRAKQARGRESRLQRFKRDELVERPMELDVMNLRLPPAQRSGELVASAEAISKSYGEKALFRDLDLMISRGDRIGIIGPNGAGKTTLIRCLLGEVAPDSGRVRLGSRLSIGYSRQTQDDLDLSLTAWQYLQSVIVSNDGQARASEQQARDLAGAFLFSGDEQEKQLADLSGGERTRAVLAGLVASSKNLLVLDEPTNHLDIPAAERLEQALSREGGYDGTLLLISHDRALLQATCEKLLIFDAAGGVRLFHGTFRDYSEQQRKRAADRASERATERARGNAQRPAAGAPTAPVRKSAPSIARIERRIEEIEQRIAAIDEEMADPAVYTDGWRCKALASQRAELERELAPLEQQWSALADEVAQ